MGSAIRVTVRRSVAARAALSTSLIVAVPLAAGAPADGASPAFRVATPRGAAIEVIAERPVGAGPFPAIVLGSGSGYDMRQPILERVAHALVANGIGVFRFDWAYRVSDPERGRQSTDRAAEIEDMSTVLALARKASWVDTGRIAVGGKSLGSIVAWRILRNAPDVRGALLLTPVCNPKPQPSGALSPVVDTNYYDVRVETRPTAWILGASDPVCAPSVLYKHLTDAGGSARIDVVRGDHTFQEGPLTDARVGAAIERSLDLVAHLSADFTASLLDSARPSLASGAAPPRAFEYARRGDVPLHLYVFSPDDGAGKESAGILLFHSGGWTRSSPTAMFERARRFAAAGLVAIPVEYRLSRGTSTPVEAFDDTCAAFRWVRAHAGELGIDLRRIAGYGASAGGVMVAATATAGCPGGSAGKDAARTIEGRPDALVLLSTGFDLERSETFRKLARPEVNPATYSPLAHVSPGLPPTFIAQGTEDTVTPPAAAQAFCERARSLGRTCELQIYPGLGHLLTRNLADQRNAAEPDPQAAEDALDRQIRFLSGLGFTSVAGSPTTGRPSVPSATELP